MKFRSSLDKYRRGKPATVANPSRIVSIETLSNEGDGVARIDGEAVFIPHTAPGDKVRVEIVEKKKRWSRAKVLELLETSDSRVEPRCPYVQRCGGCTWQHINYATQLTIKQQQLKETLQRIGGLNDIPMLDIIHSPQPFNYRNRIRGVANKGAFHFHGIRSEELIPIEHCEIAADRINDYLKTPDEPFSQSHESVELAVMEEDSVTAFKVNSERGTELGFRQVNDAVAIQLNDAVHATIKKYLSNVELIKGYLLDLYCGHGSWTRRIAEQHSTLRVVGVDVSEHNIKTARRLATNIKNASFIKNKAEKVLTQANVHADAIIVDPPRAGLSDTVVNALNEHPVPLVLYVSCHPATLARDLAKLQSGAYRISSVQAFDMFPQTPHVETLVVLKRTH